MFLSRFWNIGGTIMAGWMLLRDFVALLMFFVALYGFVILGHAYGL